jgi:HSP20 family protein
MGDAFLVMGLRGGSDSRCFGGRSFRFALSNGRRCVMFGLTPRRGERTGEHPRTWSGPCALALLRRQLASRFDRPFTGWPVPFESAWELMAPWGLEVEDTGREVVVRAELPGFEASELDVQLTGNLLTVRPRHREEAGDTSPEAVECPDVWLERTLTLPEGIDTDKVGARQCNGVMEVLLPRRPGAQPSRVRVKT